MRTENECKRENTGMANKKDENEKFEDKKRNKTDKKPHWLKTRFLCQIKTCCICANLDSETP